MPGYTTELCPSLRRKARLGSPGRLHRVLVCFGHGYGFGELSFVDDGSADLRFVEVGAGQLGPSKVDTPEIGCVDDGSRKVRITEGGRSARFVRKRGLENT